MLRASIGINPDNVLITGGSITNAAITGGTITNSALSGGSATGLVTLTTTGFTVAGLPAGVIGQRSYVTDATTPTYGAALVGGGTVVVPVFRNATIWVSA